MGFKLFVLCIYLIGIEAGIVDFVKTLVEMLHFIIACRGGGSVLERFRSHIAGGHLR